MIKYFEDAKVGYKVWDLVYGEGEFVVLKIAGGTLEKMIKLCKIIKKEKTNDKEN